MQRTNEAVWSNKYQRWSLAVQRDGERKYFYSSKEGRKGKLEVERKADKWIAEGQRNDTMRFHELAQLYLESIDTGNGTGNYRRQESTIKVWLLPRWEHRKVSSLTNRDYQLAVNAPAEMTPPRSKRTCEHIRATLSALYSYAISDRIVMEPPHKLKIPKAATVKQRKIMQPDAISRLFDPKYDNWFYIHAFRFVLIMGLRRGELCALKESDIKGEVLTIKRAVNNAQEVTQGKTENAQRSIWLPQIAKDILAAQKAALKERGIISPYIFPNTHGKQANTNSFGASWVDFRKANDFPDVTLHELRHTMISIMKSQLPETLLKQVVGHSASMDTFGIYGHEVDGEAQKSAEIINAEFAKIIRVL